MNLTPRQKKLVDSITQQHNSLKSERELHEDIWAEIAKYVLPRISDIRTDNDGGSEPRWRLADNYNAEGRHAVRLWANGMQGYMTPRNSPWAKVVVAGPQNVQRGARKYLQTLTSELMSLLRRTNFYDSIVPTFEHGVTVGTSTVTIDWDKDKQRPHYTSRHPKQVWIAENALGQVDTVYIMERMTWRQILRTFGEEPFEKSDLEAAEHKQFEYKDVLHAVFPRDERMEGKSDKLNKRWASVWVMLGGKVLLRESGFDNLRDIVWRYFRGPGTPYGWCPSHNALIDVKRGEKISSTMLTAMDLAVLPPLNVPAEMIGKVKLRPHGMNPTYDTRRKIEPIFTVDKSPFGQDTEDRIAQSIKKHYHIDFWLMMSQMDRTKTATEATLLAGEKAAVMGAETGRTESELLDPMLETTVRLAIENNQLPAPPESLVKALQGAAFAYDGPMAQLQKRYYGQQNTMQILQQVTAVGQVFPESLDNIEGDEFMLNVLEELEASDDLIRDEKKRDMMREQRAEAQQQAAQLEQAKVMSEVQKNMGGAAGPQLAG